MNRPNHETIRIQGACEHNLDNVDVEIPRDQLTVVTGLSGSGKSSLAFDTIYREGQRRYLESLSAYARQFLGQVHRPAVDSIEGLSPTLCIDQKTVNRNPRSTVGTITEVLDHLRLLMARLGTPHCPVCQREISRSSPEEIAAAVLREAGDDGKGRLWVMAPIVQDRKGEYRRELADALADGFVRARIDEQMRDLDQEIQLARYEKHTIELVVDRLRGREERKPRLTEAIEHALRLTDDSVSFLVQKSQDETPTHRLFSAARTCPVHGVSFPELEPRLFSFNAPQGMCERCSGIGWLEDFDPHLLLDPEAPPSLALRPLQKKERIPFSSLSREVVDTVCRKLDIPTDALWNELSSHQQEQLLNGADVQYQTTRESGGRRSASTRTWAGFLPATRHIWHFTRLPSLAPFRRRVVCPDCDGKRLNPMSLSVLFREHSIGEFTEMTIEQANSFFSSLTLQQDEQRIGNPIIRELKTRFAFLHDVGLGYLNLNRSAATLSGGEGQRIRLAAQVGTGLQGITYVLDEPSIGLHLRDQMKLTDALLELRDRGNTVIVVEHDPNTMERADFIIEIGPGAGRQGGRIVAADNARSFWEGSTLTARFLRGEESIAIPTQRRAAMAKPYASAGRPSTTSRMSMFRYRWAPSPSSQGYRAAAKALSSAKHWYLSSPTNCTEPNEYPVRTKNLKVWNISKRSWR